MRIKEIHPNPDRTLRIVAEDGRIGWFDLVPYLHDEAFAALACYEEFKKVSNGGYFIEWDCGAGLSADTVEAKWRTGSHAA